jgi:phosphate transport system substrate-binding protein
LIFNDNLQEAQMRLSLSRLLATTSVAALAAAGSIGTAQPAQATATSAAIFAGGSTLASQTFRQLFDCYAGKTVPGDGFTFTTATTFTSSPPSVGFLPKDCTSSTAGHVEGLYAGVGSGNGFRGYIADDPTQWYGGTVTPPQTLNGVTTASQPPFPAALPPFVDSSTGLGTYPYPQVDIGLSDSPLPPVNSASSTSTTTLTTTQITWNPAANWTTTASTTITASTFSTATYNTTNFGGPIQIPAFEVGVAIAINTTAPTTSGITWTINSTKNLTGAGSAIQLTDAQLCAIFSGLVTDWSSTSSIVYMVTNTNTNTTTTLVPTTMASFDYANTINSGVGAGTGAVPYVSGGSLPITVVFRSDGSGTSFILTSFLHNYCPLLDTGTGANANGYSAIFGSTSGLPSTSFSTLVTNINNFKPPAGAPAHSTAHFVGANASGGVAATVSNTSSNTAASAGFIGYVSADFTSPYATTVSGVLPASLGGTLISAPAPHSASLQNEDERIAGLDFPGKNSHDGGNFVAPTPMSASNAWSDPGILLAPSGPQYQLWNVYGRNYQAGTLHGGVNVGNTSILAMTNHTGAYQLSGTTYLAVYRCYTLPGRATNLVNFLTYLYGSAGTPIADVSDIIENNGFHELSSTWGQAVVNTYLSGGANGIGAPGVGNSRCVSGANQ